MKWRVLNESLDRLARAGVQARRESLSAFRVCGYAGLTLAVLLTSFLVLSLDLPPLMIFVLTLTGIVTLLAVAAITKLILGQEKLVFYHHALTVTAAVASVAWALGQPVLRSLDVLVLGLGVFHACGRAGCLVVGCCHGKPHDWGISYGAAHADGGFPAHLVGVRLFPLQAAESLWILLTVAAACATLLGGARPGEAFATYSITYAAGRFCFEFARGDDERIYLRGFSEAQLTSLLVVCAIALGEVSGVLALRAWHVGVALGVCLTIPTIALKRTFLGGARHMLSHPRHVCEIARAINAPLIPPEARAGCLAEPNGNASKHIRVERTSLDLLISISRIETTGGSWHHYALSTDNKNLNEDAVKAVASIILRLKPPPRSHQLIEGRRGVFHLISQ